MTIRQCVTCSVLVSGLALLAACSGKDKAGNFVAPDTGGAAGASSTAGSGTGGESESAGKGGSSGGAVSVLAPLIEITDPAPASDPNTDPVLVADSVTVLCSVKDSAAFGAKPVEPSTVSIQMLDPAGKSLKMVAGVPTDKKNQYSATFVLEALDSGVVSFQCTASDSASPHHTGSQTISTLLDRGPEITPVEPEDKSAHSLLGPMSVKFSVAPAPIAAKDKQAAVGTVTLTIGGTDIPTTDDGKGNYRASVDFADKKLFGSPPSGNVPIVITASDTRKSLGSATRSATYAIVVDGVAPIITIADPVPNSVIGRASILKFTVSDAGAGVDRSTVNVKLNHDAETYLSETDNQWTWNAATGEYTFNLGAVIASNKHTQVTIDVGARDRAGNASSGTSALYNLDNQPPIVDLDPERVFETAPGTDSGTVQCSDFFDPLGAAPDDLETVVNFGRFRSIIWDRTNSEAGQTDFWFALTDASSPRLYIQADTSAPLMKDTDGDGVCDELWTGSAPNKLNPTDKPLPFVKLSPLTPGGAPAWGMTAVLPPSNVEACAPGANNSKPAALCMNTSDMTVLIRHPVGTSPPFEPVVYAVEPVSQGPSCTGEGWNVSSAISASGVQTPKPAWVCMAARAVDKVGNVGISPPLRICLSDQDKDLGKAACTGMPVPSCTDKCTPPPHFASRIVRHD